MPGAKEKHSGCWIKDNTQLDLNNIERIKKVVEKEIKYISSLYPFSIDGYFDGRLVYANSVFSSIRERGLESKISREEMERISGLATGIELLGIGLSLHIFDPGKTKDDDYVLELLVGDIMYARAIIYLLKHGDFDLFRSILASLKKAHKNRLAIHGMIEEKQKSELYSQEFISEIIDDSELMVKASFLLKTSFDIGWNISAGIEAIDKEDARLESIIEGLGKYSAIERSVEEIRSYMLSLQGKGQETGGKPSKLFDRKLEDIDSELSKLKKGLYTLERP